MEEMVEGRKKKKEKRKRKRRFCYVMFPVIPGECDDVVRLNTEAVESERESKRASKQADETENLYQMYKFTCKINFGAKRFTCVF